MENLFYGSFLNEKLAIFKWLMACHSKTPLDF
jgi:hypothetical protein